jgi:hypothetical protein
VDNTCGVVHANDGKHLQWHGVHVNEQQGTVCKDATTSVQSQSHDCAVSDLTSQQVRRQPATLHARSRRRCNPATPAALDIMMSGSFHVLLPRTCSMPTQQQPHAPAQQQEQNTLACPDCATQARVDDRLDATETSNLEWLPAACWVIPWVGVTAGVLHTCTTDSCAPSNKATCHREAPDSTQTHRPGSCLQPGHHARPSWN